MKLMDVIPVSAKNLAKNKDLTYTTKFLHADTTVDVCQIEEGAVTIECEYDEALNAPHAVELCIQAEQNGYQGCFIDCFGDPGVRAARECVDIPVFGGFEPAIHIALGLGDRIGIVTVLKNIYAMLRGNVAKAHLGGRVVSIRSIDIPVLELHQLDKVINAMVNTSIRMIEEDGVEVIVTGCTGMVGVTEGIKQGLLDNGYDIPVIESCQAAFLMLELYARMGLKQSRITYMKPPKGTRK